MYGLNDAISEYREQIEQQQTDIRELVEALIDARDAILGVSKKSNDLVLFKVNNLITKHEAKDADT